MLSNTRGLSESPTWRAVVAKTLFSLSTEPRFESSCCRIEPHLEYCIHAWRSWRSCRKKDLDKLESIQSRATKMIPELRDLSYESLLIKYGLATFETGRLRYDQIEGFLILNDYEDIDRNMFFILKEGSRTRGHISALVKEQCRLDIRKYSLLYRVINEWNKLSNVLMLVVCIYLIRPGYT